MTVNKTIRQQQYNRNDVKTDRERESQSCRNRLTRLGAVSQLLAAPRDPKCVGAVLNHGKAVPIGDLVQPIYVADLRCGAAR